MFTQKFKYAVTGAVVLVAGTGIVANQVQIANQLHKLDKQVQMHEIVAKPTQIVTPTASPSATPTISIYRTLPRTNGTLSVTGTVAK